VTPKATKPGATISVNLLRPLITLLQQRGAPLADLLTRHRISPALLDHTESRIPVESGYAFFDEAALLLDEPDLGLLAAERSPIGTMGVPAYAISSSDTLGDAYRKLTRLHRLIMDLGQVELHEEGDRARLVVRLPTAPDHVYRQVVEGYLMGWLRRGRELTGVAWSPCAVRFRHAQPAKLDNHQRLFRCVLLFGQRTDELELDRSLLALRIRSAEPGLAAILDRYADEMLARLPHSDDLAGRVREAVITLSNGTAPSLWQVARSFHMTSRTLQRRLSEEKLSFRRLVDDGRRELAMRHLVREELSIAEVGQLAGFDSATSFHRAFRRWTGMTPARYRDAQRTGGA
jgi:AraC-like DNA-binding protein